MIQQYCLTFRACSEKYRTRWWTRDIRSFKSFNPCLIWRQKAKRCLCADFSYLTCSKSHVLLHKAILDYVSADRRDMNWLWSIAAIVWFCSSESCYIWINWKQPMKSKLLLNVLAYAMFWVMSRAKRHLYIIIISSMAFCNYSSESRHTALICLNAVCQATGHLYYIMLLKVHCMCEYFEYMYT